MCAKGTVSLRAGAVLVPYLTAVFLAGCGRGELGGNAVVTRLTSAAVSPSFVALPCPPAPPADPAIALAYAEPQSRTITLSLVTLSRGGEAALESSVLDRIAEGTDASTDFGSLAYARFGGIEYLSYLDRAGDGSLALKQLQGPAGSDSWTVSLTRPPGRPLCFLSDGEEVHLVVASSDGLVAERLADSTATVLAAASRPQGVTSVIRSDSGDSFTVYDAGSGAVLTGTLRAGTVSVSRITPPRGYSFGGPHHSRLDAQGRLCLLFYDAARAELVDLVDAGGTQELLRVTRAREVTAVCAVPYEGGTAYLYAETTRTAAGRPTFALEIIKAPEHGKASHGRLHASATPYGAIQAFLAGGELQLVALADTLLLVRLPMAAGRG